MRLFITALVCLITFSVFGQCEAYGLDVDVVMEHTTGDLAGLTTYRLYVTTPHTDDFLSAVYGDSDYQLNISSSTSFYQHFAGNFLGSSMNPGFYSSFPELEYDSWVTIGLDEGPDAGEAPPSLSPSFPFAEFENGGNLEINDAIGGSWFVFDAATTSNGVSGADQRILVAQLTTEGTPFGAIWVQMYNHSDNTDITRVELTFNGTTGTDPCGCTDMTACNYDASATDDDGSCIGLANGACDCDGNVLDECGTCGGPGAIYECGCADIPEGECDCDGNQLDALGECGGDCAADEDADEICDDVDECVGAYDECGVCNGPGSVYECGCADISEGDCDCEGNVLDECGTCGGPGAIYECGCADIPEGECDCNTLYTTLFIDCECEQLDPATSLYLKL